MFFGKHRAEFDHSGQDPRKRARLTGMVRLKLEEMQVVADTYEDLVCIAAIHYRLAKYDWMHFIGHPLTEIVLDENGRMQTRNALPKGQRLLKKYKDTLDGWYRASTDAVDSVQAVVDDIKFLHKAGEIPFVKDMIDFAKAENESLKFLLEEALTFNPLIEDAIEAYAKVHLGDTDFGVEPDYSDDLD